jgi:hypothetical protein
MPDPDVTPPIRRRFSVTYEQRILEGAERALQQELGSSQLSYIQFGHLAGEEGLLAAERMYVVTKRRQVAHHNLPIRI